jgi:hypothetical protein
MEEVIATTLGPVGYLRSATAIRERCGEVFNLALKGNSDHFNINLDRLDGVVQLVKAETLRHYPDLNVPYHSRWRHFNAGEIDRIAALDGLLESVPKIERCRAKLELAIVSVLLDAGAGDAWGYMDPDSGLRHKRSEGLALASIYAFAEGFFGPESCSVTSERLRAITSDDLKVAFQVSTDNPLLGIDGRRGLLNKLGEVIDSRPQDFRGMQGRLGGVLESIQELGDGESVTASELLRFVLTTFADIWPGRISIAGQNLGDVWKHSKVGGEGETRGLVPIHKLSQWLTYSLLEPLEYLGIQVVGLDHLTGLAEYRNGGLFMDGGVLSLRDSAALSFEHAPSSELIVEWRALTIMLLDETANRLRSLLGKSERDLPLAKVLQGGTWSVGRTLALGRRTGGGPPLKIASDGTVF